MKLCVVKQNCAILLVFEHQTIYLFNKLGGVRMEFS